MLGHSDKHRILISVSRGGHRVGVNCQGCKGVRLQLSAGLVKVEDDGA